MKYDDIDFDKLLESEFKEEIEAILDYIDELEYENNRYKDEEERRNAEIEPEDIYGLPGWDY